MSIKIRALFLLWVNLLWGCQQVISKKFPYVAETPIKSPLHDRIAIVLFDFQEKRLPFPTDDLNPAPRSRLEKSDPEKRSIWAKDSNKTIYGVGDGDADFVPLDRYLRGIAAQELREAGVVVVEIDGEGEDYEKVLQEKRLEYAILPRIDSFSSHQNGPSPGQKAGRIIAGTLLIAVVIVAWAALALVPGGNAGAWPFGSRSKNGKASKSWSHDLELSFRVCHITKGCFWSDGFSLVQDSARLEDMFDALLPVVMQNGLQSALKEIQGHRTLLAAPPIIAPTPTSSPSTQPKIDLRVFPPL